MAGLRRSKRLESCNQPGQDKVSKIARTSKDQEKAVTGKNKKTGESAMEGPSDPGVDTDPSPNRASEKQPDEELQNAAVSKELQQKEGHASVPLPMDKIKSPFKDKKEGFADFRRAIQTSVGLDYQQGNLHLVWDDLRGGIQTISQAAGFRDRSWDNLDETTRQRFIGYSCHAQQLFEYSFVREFILERWIWEIVDENFFSGKSQDIEWNSPYWEAQATMERILREKNFDYDEETRSIKYPNWRYTTIDLYYSLKGVWRYDLRIEPECVVKILKKALGQYFPENPGPYLEERLLVLAKTVAKFELWFDCGRETLRLVFHDPETKDAYGFPFSPRVEGFNDSKVMKAVNGFDAMYEGQSVELVVSPILVFYGSHDGYDYHVRSASFPMRVCVGYLSGCEQDEVVETEEDGEGDGEEEAKIIKDKEGVTKDEDGKNIEDEDEDEE
ncbi:hypothetical protein FDENT_11140 [Fusarium denticulatum]|uniref:Uncharacterized protein n=1 Tax=Fusarium denticulatum TaxID=48507 RepID=A0A8H5WUR6_9HYPO|nr:hypothetical protein FDENT_11140 [Fusarium denticulatum]